MGCPATDQRGYTRDAVCDIGAYEYGASGAAGGATLSSALDTSSIQLARLPTSPRVVGNAPVIAALALLDPPPVTEIVTKTYYYAGSSLIALRVLTGTVGNTLYYLHGDHLGSTSLTTDISGMVVARQYYYPYGGVRSGPDNALPTDRTFTGQYTETGLGSLMYFRARMYSPLVGRFLSADTVVPGAGNPQSLNRYSFVTNNPLKYVDPSGHCWGAFSFIRGLPSYGTTCNNLDMALTIITHPDETFQQEDGARAYALAVAYTTGEVVAHGVVILYGPEALSELAALGDPKEPEQLRRGNQFHYDTEKGGPPQTEDMYPDSDFRFKGRGEKGPDVEWVGGKHPSEYPDSTWDPNNDYGDFKTNKPWSEGKFLKEIEKDKLPPNTQPLPYDPDTGKLLPKHKFGPFEKK